MLGEQSHDDIVHRGEAGRRALTLGTVLPLWQRYCHRISTALPLINTLESINLLDTPRRSVPVER